MSKGCVKCGTQNADAAKLCRGCGAALDDQPSALAMARAGASPVCRVCGHMNRSATRFCSKCGTDQTLMTDPDPATEPADYSILASLPPRATAAAARTPAHPAAGLFGTEPAPKPLGLWLGLGALVVALVAGAAWWARSSHGTPTPPAAAASIAEPSASVAEAVVASAPAPDPASAAVAAASVPAAEAPASAPAAAAPEPAASPAAPASTPDPIPTTDADKVSREAKAKALRERRALAASQAAAARTAEQESAARRRADEARAAAAAVPAPAPPNAVAPPAAPVQPRTAQETCAGGNLIARTLCESRECSRREHADEPLCQRLRAAEEKRRQQD